MILEALKKILSDYKVNRDFAKEIKEGYRNPIENDLNDYFSEIPNYRYGGSLAKKTANTNSCDIDLLCYFDSSYDKSVEEIYNDALNALEKSSYVIEPKNSAISVIGKSGEEKWDTTVDIVPGKYTSNNDNKDVYLWCRKNKSKLKSNPELQINKVLDSKCQELIRLIKLYRTFNKFKFKSFYLEIFAIDIVEPEFEKNDDLYDMLIKFCSHYDDIGKKIIYDPANNSNDITQIHSEDEFKIIRDKIKELYEALLTNDENTIICCITNQKYNIDDGYINNAKSNFKNKEGLTPTISLFNCIKLKGFYYSKDYLYEFNSNSILEKNTKLKFKIYIAESFRNNSVVKLIVSNGGYEAYKANCLRGNSEQTIKTKNYYYREENTFYYGNHCVQAYLETSRGKIYFSDILVVKVR